MTTRNGNYCAFYVAEPFSPSQLGANATEDFCHYNLMKAWKGLDAAFPFIDSHAITYSVRDGSSWEETLKPRLRERIRGSKNIILFLSNATINSRALREEIDYGINVQELPVIVVYPNYKTTASLLGNERLRQEVRNLWDKLPIFRDSMAKVPTLHVPLEKGKISSALKDPDLMLNTKSAPGISFYKT